MSSQALLNEYLTRLATMQPDRIVELFAAEVDFFVPGSSLLPWAGRRRSRAEIVDFFRLLSEHETMEDFRIDHQFFTDDTAVVVGEFTCRFHKSGKTLNSPFMLRIGFRDGEIRQYLFLEDSHAAAEAFGA